MWEINSFTGCVNQGLIKAISDGIGLLLFGGWFDGLVLQIDSFHDHEGIYAIVESVVKLRLLPEREPRTRS